MTQKEFQQRVHNMEREFKMFFDAYGPTIGKTGENIIKPLSRN
jgi:hypothetical protein